MSFREENAAVDNGHERIENDGDSFSKDAVEFFDAMEAFYIDDMLSATSTEDSPPVSEFGGSTSASSSAAPESKANKRSSIVKNLRGRVDANQKKLRQLAHAQRIKLENQVHARRKRLERLMKDPKVVMTMDKISFVLGILTINVIEGVLLCAPDQMALLYTTLLAPLMVARYIIYKADFMHYFMYDFCYFSQLLLLLVSVNYNDILVLLVFKTNVLFPTNQLAHLQIPRQYYISQDTFLNLQWTPRSGSSYVEKLISVSQHGQDDIHVHSLPTEYSSILYAMG